MVDVPFLDCSQRLPAAVSPAVALEKLARAFGLGLEKNRSGAPVSTARRDRETAPGSPPPAESHFVGDDHHRHALLGKIPHHDQPLRRQVPIYRAGGFVDSNRSGRIRAPRDADALLLPTR